MPVEADDCEVFAPVDDMLPVDDTLPIEDILFCATTGVIVDANTDTTAMIATIVMILYVFII